MAKARVRAMVLPQCSAPTRAWDTEKNGPRVYEVIQRTPIKSKMWTANELFKLKGMYYGGSSCKEIGEKIGKSKDAVRKKVQRMIKKGELKASENRPVN